MKYEKLIFIYPFPIGSFLNAKVGLEASLEEGDDYIECYDKLSKDVKHLAYIEQGGKFNGDVEYNKVSETQTDWRFLAKNQQQPTHEEIRIGDIENDIRSCTTIAMLETYKLIVKSKPQFKAAYDEMYSQLIENKKINQP